MSDELPRPTAHGVALSTLAGCLVGALVCLAAWPWADGLVSSVAPALQPAATLMTYVIVASVAHGTGVAAFQVRYGPVTGLHHGVRCVALGLLCGSVVALALAMGIAAAADYATTVSTVVLEVLAVVGCCGLGVYVGSTMWLLTLEDRSTSAASP